MATKLKVLNLSYCDNLRRTPDLFAFKNLEILILDFCWNLKEIHPSIWYIKTLVSLDVRCCLNLKELPARVGRMEESSKLLCHDKLAQFPESLGFLESLTLLNLSMSGIKELPESISSMKALKTVNAYWCPSLARLPSSIGNLASLSLLNLSICSSLREIPDSIGKLTSLTYLLLRGTSITKLPESIGNLQNLRTLELNGTLVIELPSAIGMLTNLQELSASNCKNLEGLPSNTGALISLNELELQGSGIRGLPESISKLSSLRFLDVRYCENLGELPEPPSSLTSLHVTFPTPSLPFLSKLTLLKDLTLSDLRPLECLPELPVRLSRLRIEFGHLPDTDVWDLKETIPVLIRDKSSGLRKAIFYPDVWDCLQYDIREANPDLEDLEAIYGGNELE
ncbi:hypothetical protein BT93_J1037 [Corymbia citriodora subsp. variegata]|nr:hypothetical protein BT93_J1037 [Corymbia citriodora subsp. variegata]